MENKRCWLFVVAILLVSTVALGQPVTTLNKKDTGYRGIWYSNEPSNDQYVYKYSGGLGTYPANHYPFSVYAPAVDKTFFCYGGTDEQGKTLLHVVSYFDHQTGLVPRPTIVLDKETDNAHDNPVINIDNEGYIWLFSTANGTNRPSFIHRSTQPYDISTFEQVFATKLVDGETVPLDNFSYLQSWHLPDSGFINLLTHYEYDVIPNQSDKPRRTIAYMTSQDGQHYGEWKDIALIEEGHYQTSAKSGNRIGTVFNYHPYKDHGNGLNYRTNLYYVETSDFGNTWQAADGTPVELPLTTKANATLIKDYEKEGLNVYINDVAYDLDGNPIILYLTSRGYESGPQHGDRTWYTAHYQQGQWNIHQLTASDNNYDMGSIYVTPRGEWIVIAPTGAGAQAYNTGGEVERWISRDHGQSWRLKKLTKNSKHNHSYVRKPVNLHPGFTGFWADGHGRKPSESRLYFSDEKGRVFQLPKEMRSDFERPTRIRKSKRRPDEN